eukprot:2683259-Rhodomonas_salina.2
MRIELSRTTGSWQSEGTARGLPSVTSSEAGVTCRRPMRAKQKKQLSAVRGSGAAERGAGGAPVPWAQAELPPLQPHHTFLRYRVTASQFREAAPSVP